MGRSQETFGKKEREKKKQKKKEAKARRKEERKANPTEGDNITYVDAFGNFHDTPPEPVEKVKAKNIELGVPQRQEEVEDGNTVRKGVVTMFNHQKGYGFIKDKATQQSVFVHVNNLEEEVVENNIVTFEVEKGPKGPSAFNVKVSR